MKKPSVLVLDDDLIVRSILKKDLASEFNINVFADGKSALSFLETNNVDLALIDIDLGTGINGLSILEKLTGIDPNLSVIMISSLTSVNTVVKSIKLGALDFIEKPIDIPKLKFRIKKIFEYNEMKIVVDRYKKIQEIDLSKNEIIGESPLLAKAKDSVQKAGPMRLLLLGETGVGKTPFAKYSNLLLSKEMQYDRPFEQINCASLKHERFVDELFGHVKGAYTGAISDKTGLVELAKNGDLFLDEIGDLDLECQAELLTYLDNYEYKKLGGEKSERSKVRIICATNKNIKKMIQEGSFRSDLYSRISQCVIKIPSLRERRSDIPVLVRWFIKKITGYDKQYSSEINELYKLYPWKEGNIRELQRACEYMCFQARGCSQIELNHIDEKYFSNSKDKNFNYDISTVFDLGFTNFINEFEREILPRVLKTNESIRENAKILKMDRSTLRRKIIRYQIPVRYDPKFIEAE